MTQERKHIAWMKALMLLTGLLITLLMISHEPIMEKIRLAKDHSRESENEKNDSEENLYVLNALSIHPGIHIAFDHSQKINIRIPDRQETLVKVYTRFTAYILCYFQALFHSAISSLAP